MLQDLYSTHVKNGWPGLSYHRVITPDGTVYQINNFDDLTWTDSHNSDAFATCLIGYFHPNGSTPAMRPTQEQLVSLKECLDELSTQHPEFPADQDDVVGHKDRWATACPGDTLYPYVTEYRTKQGSVDWDSSAPQPTDPPADEDQKRGLDLIIAYRGVRKEGKEGNFEGYARVLQSRDEQWLGVQTDLVNARTALGKLEETNSTISGQNSGLQRTLDEYKKSEDTLWQMLNPLDGSKSMPAIIGEVEQLLKKEELLSQANKKAKEFEDKYIELLNKVRIAIKSSSTDEAGVLEALQSLADSTPAIPSEDNQPTPLPTPKKDSALTKFLRGVINLVKSILP